MAGWPHGNESLRFCRENFSFGDFFMCNVISSGVATRASSKHEGSWENWRQLCKPETQLRGYVTVENSPNSPSV